MHQSHTDQRSAAIQREMGWPKEARTGKVTLNGGSRPGKRTATIVQQPRRPEQPSKEAIGGFHRLDDQTVTYFQEVKSHFDTLDDPEEQALLVRSMHHPSGVLLLHCHGCRNSVPSLWKFGQVGNVLGEATGKEVKVCTDAVCSRILEALLPAAQPEQLMGFIGAFFAGHGEAFCELSAGCGNPAYSALCHWPPSHAHMHAACF